MILLESRSLSLLSSRTYTVFSKPEKAFKRPRRIPEHLPPGNVINNRLNFIYQIKRSKTLYGRYNLKHCPVSKASLVLKLKFLLFRVIKVLQFGSLFVTLRCNPYQVSKETNTEDNSSMHAWRAPWEVSLTSWSFNLMPRFSTTKFSKDLRIDNKNLLSRGIINNEWRITRGLWAFLISTDRAAKPSLHFLYKLHYS